MGMGAQRNAPAALPPGKRPGTHCTGGCVGLRFGLDGNGKYRLHLDSIPRPFSPNESLCRLSSPGTLDCNWQINPLKLSECKPHIWTVRETEK